MRIRKWLWLALLALPWVAVAEQSINPGINDAYAGANVNRWQGVFERDGREVWERRDDIVRGLNLRPGMRVADIGAGTGFFSLLFAGEVGKSGRVLAVDITPEFVDSTVQRARARGLAQVQGVVNTPRSVELPANSIDLAFMSDTYHHFEYPQSMLRSIHSALRTGGELVVIDFRRIPGVSHPWVLSHVRAGEETVVAEIRAAGFDLIERRNFMQTQYFLRFRKP